MGHMIYVIRGKKQFCLTYDEDGFLDTVSQVFRDKEPKVLNGKNADVKYFVTHQHKMAVHVMPEGVKLVKQGDLFN